MTQSTAEGLIFALVCAMFFGSCVSCRYIDINQAPEPPIPVHVVEECGTACGLDNRGLSNVRLVKADECRCKL